MFLRPAMHRLLVVLLALLLTAGASAGTRVIYYHLDAAGTPVAASDENGDTLWRTGHRPYGEPVTEPPDDIGYAGHVRDADTGLVYMGARYYDPVAGRFLGMDPAGFDESNPQSFNRYQYANNSPYRYVDPDGESPIDILFLAADTLKLGAAIYSGNARAITEASLDVAASVVGVISPVPGVGQAIKAGRIGGKLAPKITVLGENMSKRVIPFAEKVGARTIPFGTTPDIWNAMTPKRQWRLNDGAIRARIRGGDNFASIGRDPDRPEDVRRRFDLLRSEVLRLEERGVDVERVPPSVVRQVLGRD